MLPVADSVPDLNVEQVCDGIAKQGGVTFRDPAVAREKRSCIDSVSCVNESRMGGESSYTELLTCLEMARDVRNMRSEAEGKGKAAAPGAPGTPGAAGTPRVGPAPK
jgi:hypothetical protein